MSGVGYCCWQCELGWMAAVAGQEGLIRLVFRQEKRQLLAELEGVAEGDSPLLQRVREQLEQYLEGSRTSFDLPIDLSGQTAFAQKVLGALSEVGYGQIVSYGQLAALSGSPKAARAVGRVMAGNPLPIVIPCHRVMGSSGALTGYSGGGGTATKEKLLQLERSD